MSNIEEIEQQKIYIEKVNGEIICNPLDGSSSFKVLDGVVTYQTFYDYFNPDNDFYFYDYYDKKDYVANYDSDGNLMNVSGLDSKGNSFTIKFKWLDIIEENYDFYKKLSVEDLIP